WIQAARDAVSDGYATYLRLLQSSEDSMLRVCAAYILSRCRTHATEVIPIMKQHLAVEEIPSVRASLLLSMGHLLQDNEETALFFTHMLHETEDPFIQIVAAISCALSMKKQTNQEILNVLIQGYDLPSVVKERFDELPFADTKPFYDYVDLDAWISIALRSIGPSIASQVVSQVVPILIRVIIKKSNAWRVHIPITLVTNLLYLVFGDQKLTGDMTVSDLTGLQQDVLTALYKTEALSGNDNIELVLGKFCDPSFRYLTLGFLTWFRDDLGAFLTGKPPFLSSMDRRGQA
ncbi:MAG TPA: hypothetical protein VGN34_17150, partial [Ktedonobacteraceae bacterium]